VSEGRLGGAREGWSIVGGEGGGEGIETVWKGSEGEENASDEDGKGADGEETEVRKERRRAIRLVVISTERRETKPKNSLLRHLPLDPLRVELDFQDRFFDLLLLRFSQPVPQHPPKQALGSFLPSKLQHLVNRQRVLLGRVVAESSSG